MSVISHTHRTIFLHNPKCGGVSVELALEDAFRGQFLKSWHDPQWCSLVDEHISEVPEEFSDYHVFTTWRNPFAWYVSLWKFNMMRGNHPECSLDDYDPGDVVQHPFIENSKQALEMDRQPGLSTQFLSVDGLGKLEIPHRNRTQHRPWRDYYTPELAQFLIQKYSRDFECISYHTGQDLRSSWEAEE